MSDRSQPAVEQKLEDLAFLGSKNVNAARAIARQNGGQATDILADWTTIGRQAFMGLGLDVPIDDSDASIGQWNGDTSYDFTKITARDHVLVREHFLNSRSVLIPGLSRQAATMAFHYLIDGFNYAPIFDVGAQGRPQTREPVPLPGVQLVKRSDLDIPIRRNYPGNRTGQILARYGVVAGSLPPAVERHYASNQSEITRREDVLRAAARRLLFQFQS